MTHPLSLPLADTAKFTSTHAILVSETETSLPWLVTGMVLMVQQACVMALSEAGAEARGLRIDTARAPLIRDRYLGKASRGLYLIRPDQHVAGRWPAFDETEVRTALRRAMGYQTC